MAVARLLEAGRDEAMPRILVVDDDLPICETVRRTLAGDLAASGASDGY
jgi:hypothetical protein